MSLLGESAPDFSDPLAMLRACHQRMLGLCELLERLPVWVDTHGIDDEAIAAAERVMRYFDIAAPLHHADEEQDLFPLLAGHDALADTINMLQSQHRELEANWTTLRGQLRALTEQGQWPDPLNAAIAGFSTVYQEHIEIENRVLLPAAGKLLSASQLTAIGQAMAARR